MRNQEVLKKLAAATLISLVAGSQVLAADLSDGSAVISDLSVMSVEADAAVAAAAKGQDLIAISKAQATADAIKAALETANGLYAEMEKAIAAGDQKAADKAYEAIEKAKEDVVNPPVEKKKKVASAKKKAGQGGKGSSVPNIYERLGDSDGASQVAQTTFTIATANGGSTPPPAGSEQTPQ